MNVSVDPLWFADPSDQAAFRQAAIAKAAYFRAQRRGFAPGHELEDWLTAERELHGLPEHSGSVRALRRRAESAFAPGRKRREVSAVANQAVTGA